MTIEAQENEITVAILDNNIFSCGAIVCALKDYSFIKRVLLYHNSTDFIDSLSRGTVFNKVFLAFDLIEFNMFSTLDIIIDYYPNIDIVVVMSKPSINTVSLILSMGVKIVISEFDQVNCLHDVISFGGKGFFLSPAISNICLIKSFRIKILTKMERYVFNLLLNGLSPKIISLRMGISVKTVSTHKSRALKKINISHITELYL
ncbi:LuxR C-terminal-related transcriptional regulator [Klebsiella aerogenes]